MVSRADKRATQSIFLRASPGTEVVIAPSILSADFSCLGQELARCRRAHARWIHVDVMDGHFVRNITFGPPLVSAWRKAEPSLFFDTHLMIEKPLEFAEAFKKAGSDLLTIHIEATRNPVKDLKTLKSMGLLAGISIKPETPVKAIRECLEFADLVLVMTVEPGFGGQALIPSTVNKIRELDLIRRDKKLTFRLEADGGINKTTAPLAVAAGADVLVAGSAVFSEDRSISENLSTLRASFASTSIHPLAADRAKR